MRLPVPSTQCLGGTKKYPGAGIRLIYDDDEFSRGFGQIKEASRALTKDVVFQPSISGLVFRSTNVDYAGEDKCNVAYDLHISNI